MAVCEWDKAVAKMYGVVPKCWRGRGDTALSGLIGMVKKEL